MSTADAEAMERAYAVGDHAAANETARALLTQSGVPEDQARARAIIEETAPDWFLTVVGALGLGLMAWLVYNYVL